MSETDQFRTGLFSVKMIKIQV